MNVLIHITTDGERWDSIAWRYYRSMAEMPRLLEANPHLAAAPRLPSGQRVLVPLIERTQMSASPASLPPWRR